MSRYRSNRIGYNGFICVSIDKPAFPEMSCEDYLLLPGSFPENCVDAPFIEEYKELYDNAAFQSRLNPVDFDDNPATGDYINIIDAINSLGFKDLVIDGRCYPIPADPCGSIDAYDRCLLDPAEPVIPYISVTDPITPIQPDRDITCQYGYVFNNNFSIKSNSESTLCFGFSE